MLYNAYIMPTRAEDPTVVKRVAPGKRHPKRIRIRAYKYWTKCHDVRKVKAQLRDDGYHVSTITLTKWCNQEDWEAREAVESNELKRILRQSDDPVLRQLVMDDLEYVKVLRTLRGIVMQVLKQPRRYGLKPKTIKDVIELVKFLRVEREGLLGAAQAKADAQPQPRQNITIYDQRKIQFGSKLQALPAGKRAQILDQLEQLEDEPHGDVIEARKRILDVKQA
jgi:hypothetical protein